MTATNHILAGSLIALTVNNPLIALPAAFISHFVMDAIPHFGDGTINVFDRNKKTIFRVVIISDILLSLISLLILITALHDKVSPGLLLGCIAVAFSPDIGIIYRFFHEIRSKKWDEPTNWFIKFHLRIETERLWGIWVEIFTLFILVFLVYIQSR